MKRTAVIFVAIVLSLVSSVDADYTWTDTGTWPKSWPAELEPLRKQSRTFEGPTLPLLHHAIPFTKRDEFESAWPHLLKIKSQGAPIVLRRGPSFWLGDKATAGVCVHTPPAGEAPIADGKVAKGNWEKTIYIELIVDGEIIDLNRIPLPDDTPIIDERFTKNGPEKRPQQSTSAGDRVGLKGDGDKVKQAVPDRESNSYHLYTKALSATESGVVAVPSRFKWSIETSWSGIDAQGKDLPDTRVMMRLYDPEHNFTALTAQLDLATAEKIQRQLADIIAEKRKNADYQYRPQLYDSSLIPTGEIKGIDRSSELIIELQPTEAK